MMIKLTDSGQLDWRAADRAAKDLAKRCDDGSRIATGAADQRARAAYEAIFVAAHLIDRACEGALFVAPEDVARHHAVVVRVANLLNAIDRGDAKIAELTDRIAAALLITPPGGAP
jgi:hypothetical protein